MTMKSAIIVFLSMLPSFVPDFRAWSQDGQSFRNDCT